MISFDEATALVRSIAQPLGTEHVGIAQAAGRVLAAPVLAQIASPRTDVSAMDGYAVREADLENLPARLLVTSESFAGAGSRVPVGAGECARVFTGSPLPPKIDRVVMQENVRRQGDLAIIDQHPGP